MRTSRRFRILTALLWTFLSVMVLGGTSYLILVGVAPIPVTHPTVKPLQAILAEPASIEFPDTGSGGIRIIGDDDTEYVYGDQEPHAIASITKIIAALVILDRHPLSPGEAGPLITLDSTDITFYQQHIAKNGSVTILGSGWQFTQRQMLEIILVKSSNNYADSLARWAFGSTANFLNAASNWLEEQGLSSTTIVDANGLDQRNVSTVSDLLTIAELVLENPVLSEIVNLEYAAVPRLGTLENTNILLHRYPEFLGIKTGTTSVAGSCLLWAVDVDALGVKRTIVGVSLGGVNQPTLADTIEQIYFSAQDDFTQLRFTTRDEVVAWYETAWGERVTLRSEKTLETLVYGEASYEAFWDIPSQQVIRDGDRLGQLSYRDNDQLYSTELIADGSIIGPDFWWRLMNPEQIW